MPFGTIDPVGWVAYLAACGRSNAMRAPGSHNEQIEDVAVWLDRLPNELGPQRKLLLRLLDWCEGDEDVRWLTVGCSLERGNADRLSDLDVAMGVKEEHFGEALGRVRGALGDLGDLVGSYDYLMPLSFPLALYGSGRRRLVDFGRAWARFDRKGPDQPSAEV